VLSVHPRAHDRNPRVNPSFVVLSIGNSKSNHLGAQGTFNPSLIPIDAVVVVVVQIEVVFLHLLITLITLRGSPLVTRCSG